VNAVIPWISEWPLPQFAWHSVFHARVSLQIVEGTHGRPVVLAVTLASRRADHPALQFILKRIAGMLAILIRMKPVPAYGFLRNHAIVGVPHRIYQCLMHQPEDETPEDAPVEP